MMPKQIVWKGDNQTWKMLGSFDQGLLLFSITDIVVYISLMSVHCTLQCCWMFSVQFALYSVQG